MKITDVHGILMSCPLPEPLRLPFWGGERTILKRDAMLIRVKADNGLVGYAPGPAHERAAREIQDVIRPFLIGKDPRRWAEFDFKGELEITKTYRAVEIALPDGTMWRPSDLSQPTGEPMTAREGLILVARETLKVGTDDPAITLLRLQGVA